MNLIDAIKSGKPFRRNAWPTYCRANLFDSSSCETYLRLVLNGTDKAIAFDHNDVVANDWEILEPTVTFTRTQFLAAARETWEDDFDRTRQHPEEFSMMLARKLGLEE